MHNIFDLWAIYDTCILMYSKGPITVARATQLFREAGGVLRTRQALGLGINSRTLYAMRDQGLIEAMSRGVYHLVDMPLEGSDDLIGLAHRIPHGRICLISALSFHGLTTQIPHRVYCALPHNAPRPRIDYPAVRFFRFSRASYDAGVEYHAMSSVRVGIYNAEKTLADCFKFRNQIGMDTVLEALHSYRERMPLRVDAIMGYARICRVERVLRPYLEATL
jgi:predicted transcriptional regulator of viral defense system